MKPPELRIAEKAQSTMMIAAARAHPVETGGILVGVHVDGQPWVTGAMEIVTADRGRSHFRIPAGATQPAVLRARAFDQRLGYLGDWHSHPADVGPSRTDMASLGVISMRHPLQPNPTQIVVRRTDHGYVLDARRIVGLAPRTCVIELTGGLAPTTPLRDDIGGRGNPS